MVKIMLDDILKDYPKQDLADIALYNSIMELLEQIKLTYGGEGLNATLKRHKKLMLFLQKYQKTSIIDLEGKITDNLHCRMES